jgi:sugar phosphate isomerase/epimerase
MQDMKRKVQISIPFAMLRDTYLDRFLAEGLNPEIALEAAAFERFDRDDFVRIADEFHRRSLRITLHGPFMDLAAGSADRAVRAITRKRLKQMLALVPVFRPHSVVCHAGYDWRRYGYHPAGWYSRSLTVWKWLAKRLLKSGSRLMLENVYERGPEEILPLLEPLAKFGVGFCLDAGHQESFGQSTPEDWSRRLAPFIDQLHLHDNHGTGDDHLGLGRGRIDFQKLLGIVKQTTARQPIITLEIHNEKEILPSLAYLERIWPW